MSPCEKHGLIFCGSYLLDMQKISMTIQIEEDGIVDDIELSNAFLEFYKKETGHSRITRKGVASFLKNLTKQFTDRLY
jgi:hypothetical protein